MKLPLFQKQGELTQEKGVRGKRKEHPDSTRFLPLVFLLLFLFLSYVFWV